MLRFLTATLATLALAGCLGGGGGGSPGAASTVNLSNEGYATPASVSVVTYAE